MMMTKSEFIKEFFRNLRFTASFSPHDPGVRKLDKAALNFNVQYLYGFVGNLFFCADSEYVLCPILKRALKIRSVEEQSQIIFQSLHPFRSCVTQDDFDSIIVRPALYAVIPFSESGTYALSKLQVEQWIGGVFLRLMENQFFPLSASLIGQFLRETRKVDSFQERADKLVRAMRMYFSS
jgi:hypothetical protein